MSGVADTEKCNTIEPDRMLPFVFDLPPSSLHFVDNEKQLLKFQLALKEACLVGIDTETKPTFVPKRFLQGGPNPTSIIQISIRSHASKECVHIIDMLKLRNSANLLNSLDISLEEIFLNQTCLKIGQGLTNDFRELAEAYPEMKSFRLVHSVLETYDLVKYLQPVIINPISLKNLVKQYLHCNLLKTQQMSDWGRRPLSQPQIHYAACDALVLLRLYDAMYCEIEEKICIASESDSGSDAGTVATSATDHSTAAKNTMASLSRTVDFTKRVFKTAPQQKQNGVVKPQFKGLDLNNALIKKGQPHSGNKRSARDLAGEGDKRPRLGCHVVSSEDLQQQGGDVHVPLPKSTGKHTVFMHSVGSD